MSLAYTTSRIRNLAAIGHAKPKRKVGRWPPAKPPTSAARDYQSAIVRLICEPARAAFAAVLPEIMRLLDERRRAAGHVDASGGSIGLGRAAQLGKAEAAKQEKKAARKSAEIDRELSASSSQGARAAKLIDRAAATFADRFRPDALHAVVAKFGQATDKHSRAQLDQQLRSAIGVPFSAIEKPHRERLEGWAAANVDLISTISDRYFDRLRSNVEEAFTSSMHPATFAENLVEDYDISERDAERIARDQTLTLAANLNQDRMESLGVERYYWRSVNDGRVRENHADLARRSAAGETFAFDDPPMGGGTSEDEEGNPGDGIICRCFPEPVLDALING